MFLPEQIFEILSVSRPQTKPPKKPGFIKNLSFFRFEGGKNIKYASQN